MHMLKVKLKSCLISGVLSVAFFATPVAAETTELAFDTEGNLSLKTFAETLDSSIKYSPDFKFAECTLKDNYRLAFQDGYYNIYLNGSAKFLKYKEVDGFIVPECEKISIDLGKEIYLPKEFIELYNDNLNIKVNENGIEFIENTTEVIQDEEKVENDISEDSNNTSTDNKIETEDQNGIQGGNTSNSDKPTNDNSGNNNSGSNGPTVSEPEQTPEPPVETPEPPAEESGNGITLNIPTGSYLESVGFRYEDGKYVIDYDEALDETEKYKVAVSLHGDSVIISYLYSMDSNVYSLVNYMVGNQAAAEEAIASYYTKTDFGNYSVLHDLGNFIRFYY
ncbi:hypothetical protein [Clostridium sp.]|uniref:hypothetical protein n=1 Tax=Clostridium sp. TaxID=1506 RepID=UPI001B4440CA|nr:hypothetical protein [Clostridium sp.]MBP3917441.1 hypothetical protein [Clostridium sp.]